MRHFPERVENYTDAFFAVAGLILFMAFFTMAATVGMIWVLLSAALIDSGVRLHQKRILYRQTSQSGRSSL